jgi:hypothetical protein
VRERERERKSKRDLWGIKDHTMQVESMHFWIHHPSHHHCPWYYWCTNISDNNASFKTKAFPWAESPCTPTLPLSSGILITEQHHPQSKRENGKLDCYLSVKSSSWVATAANITAEMK